MTAKEQIVPAAGIKIEDLLYIFFRHKWKIAILSLATLLGAGGYVLTQKTTYTSTSKLLLRYVLETKDLETVAGDSRVRSLDSRAESIISSEIEILTSLDLAQQVATALGPAKILGKAGGGSDARTAALMISKGLSVELPKRGNVIIVRFAHRDPDVVQSVLAELVKAYRTRHYEIHRASGVYEDLIAQQTESLRARLAQTEDDLRKLKQKVGVINVEETKKSYASEIAALRQALFATEAEIAQKKASLAEIEKLSPQKIATEASELGIPASKIGDYKRLGAMIEALHRKEQDWSIEMTPDNPQLKKVQTQITGLEEAKSKMEAEYPKLTSLSMPTAGSLHQTTNVFAEAALITSLEARARAVQDQIAKIHTNVLEIETVESDIARLDRRKQMEEENYRTYSTSLEQSRLSSALGANRISNINVVQEPTPPLRDSAKTSKVIIMILFLGFGIAFGLPLLLDMVIDQSIKRPNQLETQVRLPHMLSIPYLNGSLKKSSFKKLLSWRRRAKDQTSSPGEVTAEVAPWDPNHKLHFYSEAIRDHLSHFFELHQMVHKPKLVAVTSCNRGAGVSTIAAGLAASLSETGDGNVLLVDMNQEQGAAHPFHKGKPECGLNDVLEMDKRDQALIQDNLYMVCADQPGNKLQRALPTRFSSLVPKLKDSDYDYIIFDMPVLNSTSITARLASYMDAVLMVVESEKTNSDRARRAASLLAENKVRVKTILNKTRSYGPEWLNED